VHICKCIIEKIRIRSCTHVHTHKYTRMHAGDDSGVIKLLRYPALPGSQVLVSRQPDIMLDRHVLVSCVFVSFCCSLLHNEFTQHFIVLSDLSSYTRPSIHAFMRPSIHSLSCAFASPCVMYIRVYLCPLCAEPQGLCLDAAAVGIYSAFTFM